MAPAKRQSEEREEKSLNQAKVNFLQSVVFGYILFTRGKKQKEKKIEYKNVPFPVFQREGTTQSLES